VSARFTLVHSSKCAFAHRSEFVALGSSGQKSEAVRKSQLGNRDDPQGKLNSIGRIEQADNSDEPKNTWLISPLLSASARAASTSSSTNPCAFSFWRSYHCVRRLGVWRNKRVKRCHPGRHHLIATVVVERRGLRWLGLSVDGHPARSPLGRGRRLVNQLRHWKLSKQWGLRRTLPSRAALRILKQT